MSGRRKGQRAEWGFTLVELLIAIVVVGLLAAVAILGINGLVDKGENSACRTTMDAANSASAAFYSINSAYPQTYDDLVNPPSGHRLLDPHPAVVTAPMALTGKGWPLDLIPGATPQQRTTFTGCT